MHETANTRAIHITVYSYRLKHRTLHYTIHATAVSELLQSTVTARYTITILNSFQKNADKCEEENLWLCRLYQIVLLI